MTTKITDRERVALFIELPIPYKEWMSSNPCTHLGPSPRWEPGSGEFLGYVLGLYDRHYIIATMGDQAQHQEERGVTIPEGLNLDVFQIEDWKEQSALALEFLLACTE